VARRYRARGAAVSLTRLASGGGPEARRRAQLFFARALVALEPRAELVLRAVPALVPLRVPVLAALRAVPVLAALRAVPVLAALRAVPVPEALRAVPALAALPAVPDRELLVLRALEVLGLRALEVLGLRALVLGLRALDVAFLAPPRLEPGVIFC
jgi:hypothetical protein